MFFAPLKPPAISAFVSPLPAQYATRKRHTSLIARPSRPRLAPCRRARPPVFHMTSDLPQVSAKTLFTDDISRAEELFAKYTFTVPSGTAALASSRNVDMASVAAAYGHILATSIRDTIPVQLNAKEVAAACLSAADGRNVPLPLPPVVFEQWLAAVKNSGQAPSTDQHQLALISQMYGIMLGRTVRLTAFELDHTVLAKALEEALHDASKPFPMPEADYNEMFVTLEDSAATVLGTSNLDAADRFFSVLKNESDVTDLQGDGYILAIDGSCKNDENGARTADSTSTVRFAWRVRLFDGRAIFVPSFSDGEDSGPDYYEAKVDTIAPALGCVLTGMKPRESRTAFYHPYAAREVLELLMPADQLPPQSAVVVDVFLNEVL